MYVNANIRPFLQYTTLIQSNWLKREFAFLNFNNLIPMELINIFS